MSFFRMDNKITNRKIFSQYSYFSKLIITWFCKKLQVFVAEKYQLVMTNFKNSDQINKLNWSNFDISKAN
jgi:surface protein